MSKPARRPIPESEPLADAESAVSSPSARLAGAVVALQGLGLGVLSVAYGVKVRDQGHGISAWGAAALGVAVAAIVVWVLARALYAGSPRAEAPTILLELICLGAAYNLLQEHRVGWAAGVGGLALVTLVSTVLAMRRR